MKILNFKSIFFMALLLFTPLTFSQTIEDYNESCPLYFSDLDVCAEIKWVNGPNLHVGRHGRGHRGYHSMNITKYSTLDILFYKAGDNSYTPLSFPFIKVYPWMIMHGMEHGSRPVVINRLSNGSYRVSKILFTKMNHGFWEMRFKIDQTIEQNFDPKADYNLKFKVKFTNPTTHRHHH